MILLLGLVLSFCCGLRFYFVFCLVTIIIDLCSHTKGGKAVTVQSDREVNDQVSKLDLGTRGRSVADVLVEGTVGAMLLFLHRHGELVQLLARESAVAQHSHQLPSQSSLMALPGEEGMGLPALASTPRSTDTMATGASSVAALKCGTCRITHT